MPTMPGFAPMHMRQPSFPAPFMTALSPAQAPNSAPQVTPAASSSRSSLPAGRVQPASRPSAPGPVLANVSGTVPGEESDEERSDDDGGIDDADILNDGRGRAQRATQGRNFSAAEEFELVELAITHHLPTLARDNAAPGAIATPQTSKEGVWKLIAQRLHDRMSSVDEYRVLYRNPRERPPKTVQDKFKRIRNEWIKACDDDRARWRAPVPVEAGDAFWKAKKWDAVHRFEIAVKQPNVTATSTNAEAAVDRRRDYQMETRESADRSKRIVANRLEMEQTMMTAIAQQALANAQALTKMSNPPAPLTAEEAAAEVAWQKRMRLKRQNLEETQVETDTLRFAYKRHKMVQMMNSIGIPVPASASDVGVPANRPVP